MEEQGSKNWEKALLSGTPDIAMVADLAGNILYINHVLPGFTLEKVIGSNISNYIPPGYEVAYKEALSEVFEKGTSKEFVVTGAGPDNTTAWYLTRIGAIKNGEVVEAAAVISTDITQRMLVDDDLKACKLEVERLQARVNELQDK